MSVSGDNGSSNSLQQKLNSKIPFLSLKLYVLIAILLTCVAFVSFLICLCLCMNKNSRKRKMRVKHSSGLIPLVSKEIVEIKDLGRNVNFEKQESKVEKLGGKIVVVNVEAEQKKSEEESDDLSTKSSDVSVDVGWGRWYSLRELDMATHGFAEESVIGEGGYGVVYRGVLQDGSVVAVKNLLNNKYVNSEFCFFPKKIQNSFSDFICFFNFARIKTLSQNSGVLSEHFGQNRAVVVERLCYSCLFYVC